MSPDQYPAVIIDGAVPRTDYERCIAVYNYMLCLPGVVVTDALEELDPDYALKEAQVSAAEYPYWGKHEDDVITMINHFLPDEFVCTVGEVNPGDVIVREVGHPSEEMRDA